MRRSAVDAEPPQGLKRYPQRQSAEGTALPWRCRHVVRPGGLPVLLLEPAGSGAVGEEFRDARARAAALQVEPSDSGPAVGDQTDGAVRKGRFVIARVIRGGTSLVGSDFDRCGWWPTDGASLGLEGLTATAPVQKLPGSTDTPRRSLTKADGLTVVHAERSGPADPDRPGSVAATQREAFTVLPDGTAVNVSSSALAAEGTPDRPRDWHFLDELLLNMRYPHRA